MSHSRPSKIKSSGPPRYSDLKDWLGKVDKRTKQLKEHHMAAQESMELRDKEGAAKVELLQKSNILAFVDKLFKNKDPQYKADSLEIDGDGDIRLNRFYYADKNTNQEKAELAELAELMRSIGVTKGKLCLINATILENGEKRSGFYPCIFVDAESVHGLIEHEVEERFAPIKETLARIASGQEEDLVKVSELIAQATHQDEIGATLPIDSTGKKATFRTGEEVRIINDIRRQVTNELLTPTLSKSVSL